MYVGTGTGSRFSYLCELLASAAYAIFVKGYSGNVLQPIKQIILNCTRLPRIFPPCFLGSGTDTICDYDRMNFENVCVWSFSQIPIEDLPVLHVEPNHCGDRKDIIL